MIQLKFQLNQHRYQHQVTSGAFRNSERLDPDRSDVQHLLRQDPAQLCQHGPLHPQTRSCGKFVEQVRGSSYEARRCLHTAFVEKFAVQFHQQS